MWLAWDFAAFANTHELEGLVSFQMRRRLGTADVTDAHRKGMSNIVTHTCARHQLVEHVFRATQEPRLMCSTRRFVAARTQGDERADTNYVSPMSRGVTQSYTIQSSVHPKL